ncbi:MAG: glycosyltransferase family 4 protein [Eubacteriales bacterium]
MKLTYFMDNAIPSQRANSIHIMKMCQAFSKNDIDITLYCDGDNRVVNLDEVFEIYGIENKFKIKFITLPKIIRKYGRRFYHMYSAYKKVKLFSKRLDGYIYGRSAYSIFFLRNKIKYIYESHTEPTGMIYHIEKKILHNKNCIGLITISETLKKRYLEIMPGLSRDKITVLHDCADIDVSNSSNKQELRPSVQMNNITIGYLGHLYPGKCMEVLMPIAKKMPQCYFNIVGGTDEWIKKWKNELKKQNIENIIFYGYVNNNIIGDYYRAFDICILPFSKSVFVDKRKSFDIGQWISPLKLFESMAYKKPILVSNIPTIQEVLEDEIDCLFADPNNIDEWCAKLERLIFDEELRKKLANNAFLKLKEEYTWNNRAIKIIDILNRDEVTSNE